MKMKKLCVCCLLLAMLSVLSACGMVGARVATRAEAAGLNSSEEAAVITPTPTPVPTPAPDVSFPNGLTVKADAKRVDLSDLSHEQVPAAVESLKRMDALEAVNLGQERENGPDWADIRALEQAAGEQAAFDYSFTLYKIPFTLQSEEMDLNHIHMHDDGELVRQVVACMQRLRYLCMDSCRVDDAHMVAIRDEFPQVEVVWRIWFGMNNTYSVRTNVEKILASNPGVGGNLGSAELDEKLQYCTKVKYLDLGHNIEIRDIEFLRSMPDLEVLILAINHLSDDISPIADCPHLEYLELFMSDISDLTPLKDLKELRHLNIGVCPNLTDLTPLYGLELERLYIGTGTSIPQEQIDEYRRLHPDCEVDDVNYDTSNPGWRYNDAYDNDPEYMAKDYYREGLAPRYALLREQFQYGAKLYSYSWLDPNI